MWKFHFCKNRKKRNFFPNTTNPISSLGPRTIELRANLPGLSAEDAALGDSPPSQQRVLVLLHRNNQLALS